MLYSWATPEKLLDEMSLDQLIMYHRHGWDAKQTEAKMYWGTYGMLMNESNPEAQQKKPLAPIDELRLHPGYENAYYDEKGKFHRE